MLAEGVGTFSLTLVAIGVDVGYFAGHGIDEVSRWLARGMVTAAMIYAFSSISGAHLNPAVSLAFWARGVFAPSRLAPYVCAQFLGAFGAAGVAFWWWGSKMPLGASHPPPGVAPWLAFGAEVALSILLLTVILATTEQGAVIGKQAAVAVGFATSACGFCGGFLSGASMNPARSIAPQLIGGRFDIVWIYALGPTAGALLAVALAYALLGPPSERERKTAQGSE